MAKKKKPKPFRAVTAVKELARERVGRPPTEKIVVEKKRKPEKHKPTLGSCWMKQTRPNVVKEKPKCNSTAEAV
jgi:hypothetical protein